jgi:hypothetical protein
MADPDFIESDPTNDYGDEDNEELDEPEEGGDAEAEGDGDGEDGEDEDDEEKPEDDDESEPAGDDDSLDVMSTYSKAAKVSDMMKPKNLYKTLVTPNESVPFITDFERAGILMALTSHIAADPDICVSATDEQKANLSPRELAEMAYADPKTKLPYVICRLLPGGRYEEAHVTELDDYQW